MASGRELWRPPRQRLACTSRFSSGLLVVTTSRLLVKRYLIHSLRRSDKVVGEHRSGSSGATGPRDKTCHNTAPVAARRAGTGSAPAHRRPMEAMVSGSVMTKTPISREMASSAGAPLQVGRTCQGVGQGGLQLERPCQAVVLGLLQGRGPARTDCNVRTCPHRTQSQPLHPPPTSRCRRLAPRAPSPRALWEGVTTDGCSHLDNQRTAEGLQ